MVIVIHEECIMKGNKISNKPTKIFNSDNLSVTFLVYTVV